MKPAGDENGDDRPPVRELTFEHARAMAQDVRRSVRASIAQLDALREQLVDAQGANNYILDYFDHLEAAMAIVELKKRG